MIIMISSQGDTLNSQPNPRFGSTPFFIKIDLATDTWESYPNQAVNQSGGAGVAASQFLIDHGAEAAISGRYGPNAHRALKSAGVRMFTFNNNILSISEVIEAFKKDKLEEIKIAL